MEESLEDEVIVDVVKESQEDIEVEVDVDNREEGDDGDAESDGDNRESFHADGWWTDGSGNRALIVVLSWLMRR